jgi:hypothetical protein
VNIALIVGAWRDDARCDLNMWYLLRGTSSSRA